MAGKIPSTSARGADQASFYTEKGEPVSMAVKDVLDMVNCLGYRYDEIHWR